MLHRNLGRDSRFDRFKRREDKKDILMHVYKKSLILLTSLPFFIYIIWMSNEENNSRPNQ